MKFVIFLVALAPAASGQLLEFGLKTGGTATGALDRWSWNTSEAKHYTFGPTVELRLPFRLSLEADALYKRTGERGGGCQFTYCSSSSARAHILEIPLLAKYRLWRGPVEPYASAGISLRRVSAPSGTVETWRSGPLVSGEEVDDTIRRVPMSGEAERSRGFVAGGGVDIRVPFFKLSPEFRYTRWASRYWEQWGSRGFLTGSNKNQIELLFGVRF